MQPFLDGLKNRAHIFGTDLSTGCLDILINRSHMRYIPCMRRRPALFSLTLPFDEELPPRATLVLELALLLVLSELLVESLLSPGGDPLSSGEPPPKISPSPPRMSEGRSEGQAISGLKGKHRQGLELHLEDIGPRVEP